MYGDSFITGVWSSGDSREVKTWVLGMSIILEGTSGQTGWLEWETGQG